MRSTVIIHNNCFVTKVNFKIQGQGVIFFSQNPAVSIYFIKSFTNLFSHMWNQNWQQNIGYQSFWVFFFSLCYDFYYSFLILSKMFYLLHGTLNLK